LSEILPSSGVGSGPDEVGQNVLYLWRHPQKIRKSNSKFFFIPDWKTCQGFEGLNSSLAQLAEELCPCKQPVFVRTTWI